VVVKEYTTLATTAVMVLAVLGEEAVYRNGLRAAVPDLEVLGLAILAVAVAALAVRVLKKSGYLRETPAAG
jgi:uncharacterized membrane protein